MAQTVRDGEGHHINLAFEEIREESIQVQEGNGNLNDAMCDVCFIRTVNSVGVNIALYMCYMCNTYLCQDCFQGHESHRFIKASERNGMRKWFRDEMMKESTSERKEMFDREEVSMVDRVNVKHEFDTEDCYISDFCGLDDTRWVVCDYFNHCIKIFSIGSHILQRYIRFGSRPFGVIEIKVKQEPTGQGVMPASVKSDNKVKRPKPFKRFRAAIKTFFSLNRALPEHVVVTTSDMSVTNLAESDKQCLLAITLPWKRRILFINLKQNPAVINKSIKTMKYCWSIDFSDAKMFTVGSDNDLYPGHGPWFVSVMSTDGVTIKTINTDVHPRSAPYLAVCPGRIYITDWGSDRVLCINDEGNVVFHNTIQRLRPYGISVDPDTNKVYICDPREHNVYRLDSSLDSFESLFYLKSVHSYWPEALCLNRDRLYVGHGSRSTHGHLVTVVRVL